MSFYNHPLQEREIRLVEIKPGEFPSPIQTSLQVVSLKDEPHYEALSYVCGKPNPRCTISVESEDFTVGPNLETALRHIRYHDRPRTMWIDAISINQNPQAPEKAHQIAMMGDIYGTAANVVVYAGDEGEESDFALDTIEEINDELQRELEDGTRNRSSFHSDLDLGEVSFFHRQLARDAPFDPTPWVAINRLLRRPWWRRVWTVQEVVKPKCNIEFKCGSKSISWKALHLVTLMLARYDFRENWPVLYAAGYNLFYAVQPIYVIRETWHNVPDHTLLANLVTFYYRACTDSHDKIYALFSLSSDVDDGRIHIDYQCDIRKLFTDAAALFVTSNRDPKFLTLYQSNGRMPDLPSWAPDWNIEQEELDRLNMELKQLPPVQSFLRLIQVLGAERRPPVPVANWIGSTNHYFTAATRVPSSISVLKRTSFDGNEQRLLSIDGLTHSRVLRIGKDAFQPQDQPVWHWLELVVQNCSDPYPTSQSRLEALWRTLVTNRTSHMQVAERSLFGEALSANAVEKIDAGIKDSEKRFLLGNTFMLGFAPLVYRAMSGRRFIVTDNGFMGLAPADVKVGDCIALLFGVEVPMVLRDRQNGKMEVIGACYCHGIMEGEGLRGYADRKVASEIFYLS